MLLRLEKIDNDTFFDLLLVDGINYVPFYGNASGFTAGTAVPRGSPMETIGIEDMNNDGSADIIYTKSQSVQVDYYDASGSFLSTATIDEGDGYNWHYVSAIDMLIFDSDNDNFPEVILPSDHNGNLGVVNNIGGNLSFTQYTAMTGCASACLSDFDLDGLTDVITSSGSAADYFSIFKNESGGIFHGDVYVVANFDGTPEGTTIAVGDFNNDGFSDLLTHSIDSLNVVMNDGSGHFSVSGTFYADVAASPIGDGTPLAVADFNNDGNDDAVFSNHAHQVLLMNGDGNGNFLPPVVIGPLNEYPNVIATGHFNNDAFPDIVYSGNPAVVVLLNNGTGGFTTAGGFPANTFAYGFSVNDFNGDGIDDVALIGTQTGGALYINDGSGVFTFGDGFITCSGGDLNGITSGDVNLDGYMDVLITDGACQFPHRVLIFEGDGTGQLNAGGALPVFENPLHVVVSDVNFDGYPDIVTNSSRGAITVALKNNTVYNNYYLASGEVSRAIVADDFNNDNKPDFAFNNYYSTDIGVALNSIIKIYPSSQISACTGDSVMLYIIETVPGFQWSNGATNDTIYVTTPGTYTVSAGSVNFGDCFASTKATVTLSTPAPITFDATNNPATTCINQPVNLQALPAGGVFSGPGVTGSVFDPSALASSQSYTITYSYDNSGCISSADHVIFVDACVGINELPELEIKISPNPVNDIMVIDQEKVNGYSSIELYTPYGDMVLQQPWNDKSEILNTASLASGIYYIKFIDDKNVYRPVTKRICVAHY